MPLFSTNFPAYTGPHDVGTIDVETPCEKRKLVDAVFAATGEPSFQLESVLFSLYYPTRNGVKSTKPNHFWVPKPMTLHGEGYARFANINNTLATNVFTLALWTLVGSTTIPAKVDVPLHGTVKSHEGEASHDQVDDHRLPRFPVMVFSHGMASSRTDYTHYCGELASRGYVVASIEHRDGSCPASVIMSNGSSKTLFHFGEGALDPKPETSDFKKMQLAMRQAEVEETVRVLRLINGGMGSEVFRANAREEGLGLQDWRDRLDTDQMIIGGHSYGATLALQALKGAPCPARPFAGAIILDPGKNSGPLNDDVKVPTLIVHSNSWSAKLSLFQGRPHFDVVKDLALKIINESKKFAWFMTAQGTTHPSVTDAPLIEPFLLSWTTGATIAVRDGVAQYVRVSHEFFQFLKNGHRRGILGEDVTHPEYDVDRRDQERKDRMNNEIAKHWQIHVSPTALYPSPSLSSDEIE
ncbi:PAF acetylhydrolase [Acrodontium crateriforme]|uniref:Putative phospholipase n=1 Tax=Acrodontium crateriforme TaxID=150365 RepID=A0AAQ3M7I7_9PEZI|nr:PAF acetylhydrolase [Acrodontium crateriforme]